MIEWMIEASSLSGCNCDYSCPCQFELRPSEGHCQGFGVARIERGHFGGIPLAGLHYAELYAWPGAVFEGGGTMQIVIDERADARQREALVTILHGGETEEARTHWWVFHAMCDTVHPPLFAHFQFEIDIDRRQGRASIPGLLEAVGRPIISPATGAEHRVRIDIPDGIEFEQAEIGSISAHASGAVPFDLDDRYAQFNTIRHNRHGVIHSGASR